MAIFKNTQIYLIFIIIGLSSCSNRPAINLDNINLNLRIERFDQAIDSLNINNLEEKNQIWQKQYGQFYDDYMAHMLQAGPPQDTALLFKNMRQILKTPDFRALKKSTLNTFPDLEQEEKDLTKAFKYIKYYFPQAKIPRFIAFFSGFTVQSPINEDYIGIGLDMFLGKNSPYYPALIKSIPLYLSRRFTPENIVPHTVETYLRQDLYPEPDNANTTNMLALMIYNGKILYLMDQILPEVADSLKIGYTKDQMDWAIHYEGDIWAWYIKEDLLFTSDTQKIQKSFGEAPFTPALGTHNESAPKLGMFLGWQLIRKYMEENPKMTLVKLLKTDNAQQILKESKYKGLN